MGIGGALVVFFSVAASVTFLPALLGVLGRRVDRLPVIRLHEAREGKLWRRWANLVVKRPWAAIIAAVIIIALLAWPAITMKTQMSGATTLPTSAESRQGLQILDTQFDRAAISPVSVLFTWEGDGQIDMLRAAAIFSYGQQLQQTPGVASVLSPFTISGLGGDASAMVSFWSQFQKLLNDPDNFVIPAEGITINGTDHHRRPARAVQAADQAVRGAQLHPLPGDRHRFAQLRRGPGPHQDAHHHGCPGRLPGPRGR